MKTANIVKAVCIASLAASCVWGLVACSSGGTDDGKTGGVAATVNGVEIPEDDITATVENIRTQMSLSDEAAWGQWLADNAMTPQSVREEMINSYAQQELVKQGAKEKNITVETSEIDDIVNKMKVNYENDEEKWKSALEQANMTEEEYRENIESQLIQKKMTDTFASEEEPTSEEMLQSAQMYATQYDGAKRSSHILFEATDEETAKTVLEQVRSGELDFAEAATQYSKDTGSAANGGDVGWDKLSSFVQPYTDGLAALELDQISDLVTSEFGFHIIKCTEVFTAPETVESVDQIPVEFMESVASTLKEQKQSENYQTWLTEYQEAAEININEMPEGLSYSVDMSQYTPAEGSAGATAAEADAAAGEGTEGEAPAEGEGTDADAADAGAADANADSAEQPAEGEAPAEQPAEDSATAEQPAEAA